MDKKALSEAYKFLREKNHSIPDEVIDFMYRTSVDALEKGDVITRLRGQLQNCVDHLHMMKRKVHPTRSEALSLDKVIEQANKALYETLGA